MELTLREIELLQEGLGSIECPSQDVTALDKRLDAEHRMHAKLELWLSGHHIRQLDEALEQWEDICADGGDTEMVTDEMRSDIGSIRRKIASLLQGR